MIKLSKIYKHVFFAAVFLSSLLFSINSKAELSLLIDNQEVAKTKILFLGFESRDPSLNQDIKKIFQQIRSNLNSTNLFELVKQDAKFSAQDDSEIISTEITNNSEIIPDFEKYNRIGVGAVLIADFGYDPIGNIEVKVRFWDILDEKQLFGKFYSASSDINNKVANIISDEIFMSLTNENSGHFNSKIIYVSETGSAKRRIKKIAMMDFDGKNHQYLTSGHDLVLTPTFTKNANEIYYLRYFDGKSQIFSLDLSSLRSKKVGGFRGTTFGASVHPKNPNIVLLSAIINDNSDIYELDIENNVAKRLTKNSAIDVTASYSPDGESIAFASDRSYGQQIYVMDKNGFSVSRVSFGGGSYSSPKWSPDGKLLAFTKILHGKFHIGVMLPSGKGEKILTSAYMAEGARWSPNGRYLIYSKKDANFGNASIPRLYAIDVITGFELKINTPDGVGASDPDWQ